MPFIGNKPTAVPLTSADIQDGTIGLADLSATGTKDSTTFLRGDNTFASAGGTNTPAFFVYKNSSQTISDATTTKVTWNTEVYDTHNAFASDKFTVPSGHAGKYHFTNFIHVYDENEVIDRISRSFRKNGSQVGVNDIRNTSANIVTRNSASSIILDLSAGDYIETYIYANTTDNSSFIVYGESQYYTYFYGYKIIE